VLCNNPPRRFYRLCVYCRTVQYYGTVLCDIALSNHLLARSTDAMKTRMSCWSRKQRSGVEQGADGGTLAVVLLEPRHVCALWPRFWTPEFGRGDHSWVGRS